MTRYHDDDDESSKDPQHGFTEDDVIFLEPKAARNYSDPFISVWEGDTRLALHHVQNFERNGIPVESDASFEPGRTQLAVPRSYAAEALSLITDNAASPGDYDSETVDNDNYETLDYHEMLAVDWARIAWGFLAILVLVGLVVSYGF